MSGFGHWCLDWVIGAWIGLLVSGLDPSCLDWGSDFFGYNLLYSMEYVMPVLISEFRSGCFLIN